MPGDQDSTLDAHAAKSHPGLPIVGLSRALLGGLVAGIVVLDQASKAAVRAFLALHESVTIVPGFLNLVHVRNSGAAFGLLNGVDVPYKQLLMTGIALGALIAISVFAVRTTSNSRLAQLGLALVLGGASGNLIDRATAGFVVDFVDVYWRGWHFWAFNVADSAITIGAALLIIDVGAVGPPCIQDCLSSGRSRSSRTASC